MLKNFWGGGDCKVTLAPNKNQWTRWTGSTIAFFRAHLPATKFLESGPTLLSNQTGGRLDLFHHAPSKACYRLARVLRLRGWFDSTIPAAWFPWSTLPAGAGKGWTLTFHKKSIENLWKSVDNILWTTDDSVIGKINICRDPDSAIGRKRKNSSGAKRLDKISSWGPQPLEHGARVGGSRSGTIDCQ